MSQAVKLLDRDSCICKEFRCLARAPRASQECSLLHATVDFIIGERELEVKDGEGCSVSKEKSLRFATRMPKAPHVC